MTNPYHDENGRFCSKSEMEAAIHRLDGEGRTEEALKLIGEYMNVRNNDEKTDFLDKVNQNQDETPLVLSHGQMVRKGVFKTSDFARGFNTRTGTNSYFEGSWEELENLVKTHKDDFEPGTGSVDNDVILVNVPPKGFYTSIVEITPENEHLVEEVDHVRMEGEKSVPMRVMKGTKQPASYVQIVCYRADVLAQDDDRSNDAEWEIIAVNAQVDKVTPMHPTTMLRNANHEEGGTARTYTDKEWADAYSYWATHAYIDEV